MARKGKRAKASVKPKLKASIDIDTELTFPVQFIGCARGENPLTARRVNRSEVRPGDFVYFIFRGSLSDVYAGTVGEGGEVRRISVCATRNYVKSTCERLGYSKKLDILPDRSHAVLGRYGKGALGTSTGSPSGGRRSSGPPVEGDADELRAKLIAATEKGEKRKIRAALRKLGVTGGLRGNS